MKCGEGPSWAAGAEGVVGPSHSLSTLVGSEGEGSLVGLMASLVDVLEGDVMHSLVSEAAAYDAASLVTPPRPDPRLLEPRVRTPRSASADSVATVLIDEEPERVLRLLLCFPPSACWGRWEGLPAHPLLERKTRKKRFYPGAAAAPGLTSWPRPQPHPLLPLSDRRLRGRPRRGSCGFVWSRRSAKFGTAGVCCPKSSWRR